MVHTIRLRGPWRLFSEPPADPLAVHVKMPCTAAELLAGFPQLVGMLTLERRFHQPTGLMAGTRVDLVLDAFPVRAMSSEKASLEVESIRLNGRELSGAMRAVPLRVPIGDILQASNVLELVLQVSSNATPPDMEQTIGDVWLEIEDDEAA